MEARDTKARILECAAAIVQSRGYNGFSFNDLAAEIGIKTASIHYHFPTKASLGQALVRQYTDRFMALLGDPTASSPHKSLRAYIALFRSTLAAGRMCMCGIIGAEIDGIPEAIAKEVKEFFSSNHDWLKRVFEFSGERPAAAARKARLFLSALEGAMLIARAGGEHRDFAEVAETALALCEPNAERARR